MSKKLSTPKIVVIVGPTASGKTDLAIKLAKKYNGEIISADSRQIYRGLNIGTAKPPISSPTLVGATKSGVPPFRRKGGAAEYVSGGIPHHLIDIRNPDQPYTVAHYKKDAIAAIKKVLKKNKLPILVGGTGLYIKAVIDNLEIPEVKPNPRLRKRLEKKLKEKGLNFLYEQLIKLDPEAAYIVDRNNPRRIIRALEITIATNKPFSGQRQKGEKLFNALRIGMNLPKEKLREKINKRVDLMLRAGLVNETKQLIKKYDPDLPVFDAIGYREIINYLQGEISLPEAIDLIKKNTWHYAKRQITWFRKDTEIRWIKNEREGFRLVEKLLKIQNL